MSCQNCILKILSQFEFCNLITIWIVEFVAILFFMPCTYSNVIPIWDFGIFHNTSFWVLSLIDYFFICHKLSLLIWSYFEFLKFVTTWVFEIWILFNLIFLSFLKILVLKFFTLKVMKQVFFGVKRLFDEDRQELWTIFV